MTTEQNDLSFVDDILAGTADPARLPPNSSIISRVPGCEKLAEQRRAEGKRVIFVGGGRPASEEA